jgi:hypothetical protein
MCRLSLERAGWEFDTRKEDGDYVYIVVSEAEASAAFIRSDARTMPNRNVDAS